MIQMDFPYFDETVSSYCRYAKGHYVLSIIANNTITRFYLTEAQLLEIEKQIKNSLPKREDQSMNMLKSNIPQVRVV